LSLRFHGRIEISTGNDGGLSSNSNRIGGTTTLPSSVLSEARGGGGPSSVVLQSQDPSRRTDSPCAFGSRVNRFMNRSRNSRFEEVLFDHKVDLIDSCELDARD
jgi:hypothetical protein